MATGRRHDRVRTKMAISWLHPPAMLVVSGTFRHAVKLTFDATSGKQIVPVSNEHTLTKYELTTQQLFDDGIAFLFLCQLRNCRMGRQAEFLLAVGELIFLMLPRSLSTHVMVLYYH